ncbi:thioesterase family protein [Ilumatobacter sp.]|uniref:thioesterase family protein n=1 Tax=Ilumatobacter sp. TaxID=1967498 RepID=UPI003C377C56
MNRFADATAVRSIGDGRYAGVVHEGWDIGGNANGGYLLAIAARAMADAVGRPPLTVTAHYLRPAPAADCEIDVAMVRSGRRLATATASLSIGGKSTLQVLGSFGEQTPGGPSRQMEEQVGLPAYTDCVTAPPPNEGPNPALMEKIDVRMLPEDGGFRSGEPSGRAEISGWFALADEEPVDAIGLMLVADAFPPPVFNSGLPVAWVPTVELTVHVRGVPAPGPLRCSFRSRFIHDGLLDEEGEVWDSTGTLVCQSRQLALMPRP